MQLTNSSSTMSDSSRTTLLLLATAAASCGVTALAAHLLQTARLRRRQQQEDQQKKQQSLLGCSGCCSQLHGGAGRRRPDPYDTRPRTNFLTWDDYFMAVAFLSAERSKDPNKQVGACIVNTDNIILSIGYNGFPRGCSDTHLPWSKRGQSILDTKYPYVVHAEANALLNKNQAVIAGARIYVTLFPCNECAKLLIQAGIKEVVFHEAKLEPTGRRPATMEQAAAEDAAADAALIAGREQQQQQHASLCSISSTTDQRFAVGPVADLNASYVASQRLLTMAGVKLRQHQLQRAICVGHNSAPGSSDGRVSW